MRLAAGVLFLIGSLVRGSVSVLGLAFLIAGLLFELLVCKVETHLTFFSPSSAP